MSIPVELVVLVLTGATGFFSIAIHLLLGINKSVNRVAASHERTEAVNEQKFASLSRHNRRNQEEMDWMRRHVRIPESPLKGEPQ